MSEVFKEDKLFLEATHYQAVTLLERHISRREEWSVAKIREEHNYPRLLYQVSERKRLGQPIEIPSEIINGLVITLLTENGITYYPRDVGRIFNPLDKDPSENDPHEEFTRRWTSEEFPHGEGLLDSLWLTGYDMKRLEKDRMAFQLSGLVPRPADSASGVAYTGTQELSTSSPYQNLTSILKETINTTQDELARDICNFMIDVVRHISQDERLHAAFINGNAVAALETNDKTVVSFLLRGIALVIPRFAMPGDGGMPNFRELAKQVDKDKVFSALDLARIKYRQLTKTWKVAEQTALTPEGEESQEKMIAYTEKLVRVFPKIVELEKVTT